MNEHKAESLHLYSMALSDPSYKYRGLAFLDTALLLMCLDVGIISAHSSIPSTHASSLLNLQLDCTTST
jgi:hypothetical protein